MNNEMTIIEQVMLQGNLKALSSQQKVQYYSKVCESLGLNPLTKPFEYITLNGKEVLYATKACTEQLRLNKKVSLKIVDRQKIDGVYIITAEAKDSDGREDSATGAVAVEGLKGDALANAMMKAETKAKRRVTLSICGLGILDESEIETIPSSAKEPKQVKAVIYNENIQNDGNRTGDKQHESVDLYDKPISSTGDAKFSRESNIGGTNEIVHQENIGTTNNYTITFGKDKGKTIEEIGLETAISRVEWFRDQEIKTGKMMSEQVIEFCKQVEMRK